MRKILLSGCNGRMGRAFTAVCDESDNLSIAAGLDINTIKLSGYPVYADPMEFGGYVDCAVDFSHTSALRPLLSYCLRKKTPLVLCTTGYDEAETAEIKAAAKEIPVFMSGNMSLGVNMLIDLVSRAAKVLGEQFDIEIIERHHNQKLDAPSGTAAMLFNAAAQGLSYEPEPVYDRHLDRKTRGKHEIGIHAVRGGTIVGEHEVVFAGRHETLSLSHSADSREVFAAGAARAVLFMSDIKVAGLYSMSDIFK